MRITCISDLHGTLPEIPVCDILLVAGDVLPLDIQHYRLQSVTWLQNRFAQWAESTKAKHIVMTAGNHDFVFEDMKVPIEGVDVLIDKSITIEGLKIWGSPWSLPFFQWAFMATEEELQKKYDLIPDDTNIILSHTPPYSVCDLTTDVINAGSKSLLSKIVQLPELKLVVSGHIHEARGIKELGLTTIVNASVLDENYNFANKPWEFEL